MRHHGRALSGVHGRGARQQALADVGMQRADGDVAQPRLHAARVRLRTLLDLAPADRGMRRRSVLESQMPKATCALNADHRSKIAGRRWRRGPAALACGWGRPLCTQSGSCQEGPVHCSVLSTASLSLKAVPEVQGMGIRSQQLSAAASSCTCTSTTLARTRNAALNRAC